MIPRVTAGGKLSAKTFNQLVDAANTAAPQFSPDGFINGQSGQLVFVVNLSEDPLPLGSCVAYSTLDSEEGNPFPDHPTRQIAGTVLGVNEPDASGDPWLITAQRIPAGLSGWAYASGVVLARVRDETSTDESVDIDADDDWWHLKQGSDGPGKVLWVDSNTQPAGSGGDDSEPWRWALIRFPIGGAGGGEAAEVVVVQAQADGASGVVSVKNIALKGDLSASPNYEVTGDAYNVAYLKS